SGCTNCYACKEVVRMAGNPNPKVAAANRGLAFRQKNGILDWTGVVRRLPERLAIPFRCPRGSRFRTSAGPTPPSTLIPSQGMIRTRPRLVGRVVAECAVVIVGANT